MYQEKDIDKECVSKIGQTRNVNVMEVLHGSNLIELSKYEQVDNLFLPRTGLIRSMQKIETRWKMEVAE